ncbi:MAG: M12 family metallo-peptidase [Gammaproteobacteria bacterium]|nr:M12 family metallo-peptidase [Gammaproteobacteria bacterium]
MPQLGAIFEGIVERLETDSYGNVSYVGLLTEADGRDYRFIITAGARNTFAHITTSRGTYELVAKGELGWLMPTAGMDQHVDYSVPDYIIPSATETLAPGLAAARPLEASAEIQAELVCPCRVETSGSSSIDVRFGIRNLKDDRSTGPLEAKLLRRLKHSQSDSWFVLGEVELPSLAANATLSPKTHSMRYRAPREPGAYELRLALHGEDQPWLDSIYWLSEPVDIEGSTEIATGDADILVDIDEDGVSDVNERLMNTDPKDAESKPADPTIDLLTFYSSNLADLYDGDPSTRIRHVTTLADAIFSDSGVDLNLRLVGIALADIDEESVFPSISDTEAQESIDRHGADLAVIFTPYVADSDGFCGRASLNGFRTQGTGIYDGSKRRLAHVYGDCGADTMAHEIGHLMGLAHSYAQKEVGTFRWARGYGVTNQFATIMAYERFFGNAPEIDRFSTPEGQCKGLPCGVEKERVDGADAVTALNTTRFQVANFAEPKPDSDNDGFVDPVDAFPNDATEQIDSDGDGTGDNADTDDDNDGVMDEIDPFPLDATEWADTDGDGLGDNADAFPYDRFEAADTDGDGVGDNADLFPNDPTETIDTDNDGVGNNGDAFPYDTREWLDTDGDGTGDNADTDDDGDGVADMQDAFPRDSTEWADTDGDGTGNNADADDDGDGVPDIEDALPLNPDETSDTDSDGVGDFADAFPNDATESADTDRDGTGDNADTDDDGDGVPDASDAFPRDPGESSDDDGDGVGNNADAFPNDPTETLDTDHDGVGDNRDAFPENGSEWIDSDGDGAGDNADTDDDNDGTADIDDALPLDPHETADDDGDGVGNNSDAFPNDAAESVDTDGDGIGNNADTDDDGDGTLDTADAFPTDASETVDADGDGVGDNADAFPHNSSEWADTDKDGAGNNADADDDGDMHTDGIDLFPLDASRARVFHYRLSGEHLRAQAGRSVAAGDLDGDGKADILIGAPGASNAISSSGKESPFGAVYAVSGTDFVGADTADGAADQTIELGNIAAQPASYVISGHDVAEAAGFSVSVVGDMNGDGRAEWVVGNPMSESQRGGTYLVSHADLDAADSANGLDGAARLLDVIDGSNSWRFPGDSQGGRAGSRVAAAGDVDADGSLDFLIGAPHTDQTAGAVYLVSGAHLDSMDANDGDEDGVIDLEALSDAEANWKFEGEKNGDLAGSHVATAGDTDNDGRNDIIITAPHYSTDQKHLGAVYLIAAADLAAADEADSTADGAISLGRISAGTASWKLVGEASGNYAGWAALTADLNGDGTLELVVGAPGNNSGRGAVYVIPVSSLDMADDADGTRDRVVSLGKVAVLANAYKFNGDLASVGMFGKGASAGLTLAAGDLDGDGKVDLVVGSPDYTRGGQWCPALGDQRRSGAVYVISGAQLGAADRSDGDTDGVGQLANIAGLTNSWKLLGEPTDSLGGSISAAADLDGDGRADLLLGGPDQFRRAADCGSTFGTGIAMMVSSADLAVIDRFDGAEDGVVDFEAFREARYQLDSDFDGAENALDTDDDNDGVADTEDAFPFNPMETADNDHDGTGDNADADDDNDGTPDLFDVFPLDPYETLDSDGDGTGDNADTDDDNDGALDLNDAFPLDASESLDSDGDGIGDNADTDPNNAAIDTDGDGIVDSEDSDDDGDGVSDSEDVYPLNPARSDDFFYRIAGTVRVVGRTDFDGDGKEDLLAGTPGEQTFLLSAADLGAADLSDGMKDRAIDLDQITTPARSRKLDSTRLDLVFPAGDIDADGKGDLIRNKLLLPASALSVRDSAIVSENRVVSFDRWWTQPGVSRIVGEQLGWGVFSTGDLNADLREDLMIGANYRARDRDPEVAVYVVSGADLLHADMLDGNEDDDIDLDKLASRPGSWKLTSETDVGFGANVGLAGDVNGDGRHDLMMGAPDMGFGANPRSGAVIIISGVSMAMLDASDGTRDGGIRITQARQAGTWRLGGADFLTGEYASAAGDVDGDGLDDILVSSRGHPDWSSSRRVHLITGAGLLALGGGDAMAAVSIRFDGLDYGLGLGDVDGDKLADMLLVGEASAYLISGRDMHALGSIVDFAADPFAPPASSWRFKLSEPDREFGDTDRSYGSARKASIGDLDGDGILELILPTAIEAGGEDTRSTYLLSVADLPHLDALDKKSDRTIELDNLDRTP